MTTDERDIDEVIRTALHGATPRMAPEGTMRARIEQRIVARRRRARMGVALASTAAATVVLLALLAWNTDEAGTLGVLGGGRPRTTTTEVRPDTEDTTTMPPTTAELSEPATVEPEGAAPPGGTGGSTTTVPADRGSPPAGVPVVESTTTTSAPAPADPQPCRPSDLEHTVSATVDVNHYAGSTKNRSGATCTLAAHRPIQIWSTDGRLLVTATDIGDTNRASILTPGRKAQTLLFSNDSEGACSVWSEPGAVTTRITFSGTGTLEVPFPGRFCLDPDHLTWQSMTYVDWP